MEPFVPLKSYEVVDKTDPAAKMVIIWVPEGDSPPIGRIALFLDNYILLDRMKNGQLYPKKFSPFQRGLVTAMEAFYERRLKGRDGNIYKMEACSFSELLKLTGLPDCGIHDIAVEGEEVIDQIRIHFVVDRGPLHGDSLDYWKVKICLSFEDSSGNVLKAKETMNGDKVDTSPRELLVELETGFKVPVFFKYVWEVRKFCELFTWIPCVELLKYESALMYYVPETEDPLLHIGISGKGGHIYKTPKVPLSWDFEEKKEKVAAPSLAAKNEFQDIKSSPGNAPSMQSVPKKRPNTSASEDSPVAKTVRVSGRLREAQAPVTQPAQNPQVPVEKTAKKTTQDRVILRSIHVATAIHHANIHGIEYPRSVEFPAVHPNGTPMNIAEIQVEVEKINSAAYARRQLSNWYKEEQKFTFHVKQK